MGELRIKIYANVSPFNVISMRDSGRFESESMENVLIRCAQRVFFRFVFSFRFFFLKLLETLKRLLKRLPAGRPHCDG